MNTTYIINIYYIHNIKYYNKMYNILFSFFGVRSDSIIVYTNIVILMSMSYIAIYIICNICSHFIYRYHRFLKSKYIYYQIC